MPRRNVSDPSSAVRKISSACSTILGVSPSGSATFKGAAGAAASSRCAATTARSLPLTTPSPFTSVRGFVGGDCPSAAVTKFTSAASVIPSSLTSHFGMVVASPPTTMIICGSVDKIASPALEPARKLRSTTRPCPLAMAVNLTESSVPSPLAPPVEVRAAFISVTLPFLFLIVPF